MIEVIRKHIHGWFSWVFLICIAVVFIFWGTIGLRLDTKKYIDVNGQKIYPYQLDIFKQIFPRADLVQITLGIQQLNNVGFYISEYQVDDIIKSMPDFQISGKFSPELYTRLLSNNPRQIEMIRLGTYYNTIVEQMSFALQLAQAEFPSTTAHYFKLMDQKRTISSLLIENNKFINNIVIDNKEIEQYYNANKTQFTEPVKAKLQYIKLSYADIVKTIKPTEKEIADFYNNNQDQFTVPGRKNIAQIVINNTNKDKLTSVVAELNNSNFGKLAEKYSDDLLTAKKQGDAGWFQSGDMGNQVLDKAVANLTKIDEISPVIDYDGKHYLFKLVKNEPRTKLNFKDIKTDIVSRVAQEKANASYTELKEQLERKSFEIADSLDIVAQELGLKTETTDWVNKDKIHDSKNINNNFEQELVNNPKVITAAFSEDVFDNRNNSNLIDISQDTSVVVRIAELTNTRIKDLAEVKEEVVAQLKVLKSKQKANEFALKLWKEFSSNSNSLNNLENLSKDNGNNNFVKYLKPISISYLDTFWDNQLNKNDNNYSYSKEELKEAFLLPKPNQQRPLQAKLLELNNGDQVILAVNNVSLGNFEQASKEQKLQAANQLKSFMMMRDNANFFNRINQDAKVKSYL